MRKVNLGGKLYQKKKKNTSPALPSAAQQRTSRAGKQGNSKQSVILAPDSRGVNAFF